MIYILQNHGLNMNKFIDHEYLKTLCNGQGLSITSIWNDTADIIFVSEVDTFTESDISKINQACTLYLPYELTCLNIPQ